MALEILNVSLRPKWTAWQTCRELAGETWALRSAPTKRRKSVDVPQKHVQSFVSGPWTAVCERGEHFDMLSRNAFSSRDCLKGWSLLMMAPSAAEGDMKNSACSLIVRAKERTVWSWQLPAMRAICERSAQSPRLARDHHQRAWALTKVPRTTPTEAEDICLLKPLIEFVLCSAYFSFSHRERCSFTRQAAILRSLHRPLYKPVYIP